MKRTLICICAFFLVVSSCAESKPNPSAQKEKIGSVVTSKEVHKVVDYFIISEKGNAFVAEVKKLIADGWQPWGDVVIQTQGDGYGGSDVYCIQAMVKYE